MSVLPTPEPPARPGRHLSASPLHDLMYGNIHAAALRAVVLHDIPGLLADGPLSAEALADRSGTRAGPLRRVLRLLVQRGVFERCGDGTFGLTDTGRALCADIPGSQRDAVLLFTDEMFRRSAESVEDTLRTGRTGFDAVYGLPFFAHLGAVPEKGRLFDAAMSSITSGVNGKIVEGCPLPRTGTVVDVAGGRGGLLREVLTRHSGLTGVLFDRPETVGDHVLDTGLLRGRWRAEGGDIFTSVPEGGDLYLLKNILHDWSDEDCLRILTVVRRAAGAGTRLLVIEAVLPEDGSPHPAVALDLVMMMALGGRERTAGEFEDLLNRSGFRLEGIAPTRAASSVIEAEAV